MLQSQSFVSLSLSRDSVLESLYRYFSSLHPNFSHLWNTLADTKNQRVQKLLALSEQVTRGELISTMVPNEMQDFENYVLELQKIYQICYETRVAFLLPTVFKMTLMFEREAYLQNCYHLLQVSGGDGFISFRDSVSHEIEADIQKTERVASEVAISPIFNPLTITELREFVEKKTQKVVEAAEVTKTFHLAAAESVPVAQIQKEMIKNAAHTEVPIAEQRAMARDFMTAPGSSSANPNLITEEGVQTPSVPIPEVPVTNDPNLLHQLEEEIRQLKSENQRLQNEMDKLLAVFNTLKANS